MYIKNCKKGYVLASNPIVVREDYPAGVFDHQGGRLNVFVGGVKVFAGHFEAPLDMDISEIVEAAIPDFPRLNPGESDNPLIEICDADLSDFEVRVVAEYAGYEHECSFIAYPGGLSKLSLRLLSRRNTDAFEALFFKHDRNFFLLSRSNLWTIEIPETELAPLCFYADTDLDICIKEGVTQQAISLSTGARGIFALDLVALRRKFATTYGVLPSWLEVEVNGVYACRIVITEVQAAPELYRLTFRNSLGVFETLTLHHEITVTTNEGNDSDSYRHYDPIVRDFVKGRPRTDTTTTLNAETRFVKPEELYLVADMLSSEEVYLTGYSPEPMKVIVGTDKVEYAAGLKHPSTFKLTLTYTEDECRHTPALGRAGTRPKSFSSQFDDKFN